MSCPTCASPNKDELGLTCQELPNPDPWHTQPAPDAAERIVEEAIQYEWRCEAGQISWSNWLYRELVKARRTELAKPAPVERAWKEGNQMLGIDQSAPARVTAEGNCTPSWSSRLEYGNNCWVPQAEAEQKILHGRAAQPDAQKECGQPERDARLMAETLQKIEELVTPCQDIAVCAEITTLLRR